MASFDMVSSLAESLSRSGALNSIRAQLKASILDAINNENVVGAAAVSDVAGKFAEDRTGRLVLSLVKDVLETLELGHTLNALSAELGEAGGDGFRKQADREGLARELQLPFDTIERKLPLLVSVLTSRTTTAPVASRSRSPSASGSRPTSPNVGPPSSSPTASSPPSAATAAAAGSVITPLDTKTLSQRRSVSLSVSPDSGKPVSPSAAAAAASATASRSRPLSPVSPTASGSADLTKQSWSPSLPVVESRGRVGILNPLPLSSTKQSKLGEIFASAKGTPVLNLADYGPLQSSEVQMLVSFLSQHGAQIEVINLHGCSLADDVFATLFEAIHVLPRLRQIDISRNVLTNIDPRLFLMPSLTSCNVSGNKLPPVLAEATFPELQMYAKQKLLQTQRQEEEQQYPEEPEESDSRELSSSFEVDSPDFKPSNSALHKARNPLTHSSRLVEVQQKAAMEKAESTSTSVQRISGGGAARSKSGWGTASDGRDGGEDDDFVFTEDQQKTISSPTASVDSAASSSRRLNPLSNRASRRTPPPIPTNSAGAKPDILEQSTGSSFIDDEQDMLQRSYVSNQDDELSATKPATSKGATQPQKSPKAQDYGAGDEYGDDDFEEIEEEDFSIGEKSSDQDDSRRFDDSSELSPSANKAPKGGLMSALSRTKSGFISTASASGKKHEASAQGHSEDEADQEAQEESSPPMQKMKAQQRGAGVAEPLQLKKPSSTLPPASASSGWAKSTSAPLSRGGGGGGHAAAAATTKSGPAKSSKPSSDTVVADFEEQSLASEEIDALEFSMGGADSDSNGSFSFLNDESLASHKSKAVATLKSARSVASASAKRPALNQSTESAEVDFSVTETDLSTSHGVFETADYDYSTSALPPALPPVRGGKSSSVPTVKAKNAGGW